MTSFRIIVFLGNPGKAYQATRHNFGWRVADAVAERYGQAWVKQVDSLVCQARTGDARAVLAKPQSFMNLSGLPVRRLLDYVDANVQQLLVVHDELELPFGTLAVKTGGGAGGHKGLRSIVEHLGGGQWLRLRLGIGRPTRGSVHDWVLERFASDEAIALPLIVERAVAFIDSFVLHGSLDPVVAKVLD